MQASSSPAQHMHALSRLMVRAYCENRREIVPQDLEDLKSDLHYVARLNPAPLGVFLELANTNHVIVRALDILQSAAMALGEHSVAHWCERYLADERARIKHSLEKLQAICDALESHGCRAAVIKSLDQWPDLGSDLDLYTTADERHVQQVMQELFGARPVERSWGDRLANKWNYSVPDLPELVEIHVQFLGQTGEFCRAPKCR